MPSKYESIYNGPFHKSCPLRFGSHSKTGVSENRENRENRGQCGGKTGVSVVFLRPNAEKRSLKIGH